MKSFKAIYILPVLSLVAVMGFQNCSGTNLGVSTSPFDEGTPSSLVQGSAIESGTKLKVKKGKGEAGKGEVIDIQTENAPWTKISDPRDPVTNNPVTHSNVDPCEFNMTRKFSWKVGTTYNFRFSFNECERVFGKSVQNFSVAALLDANNSRAGDVRFELVAPNGFVIGSLEKPNLDAVRIEGLPNVSGPNPWIFRLKLESYSDDREFLSNPLLSIGIFKLGKPACDPSSGLRPVIDLFFGPGLCTGQ